MDSTEKNPSPIVVDACLQLRCLATDFLYLRAFAWSGPHRKQFPFYCCLIRVYRAVAWQRVDQIRYNTFGPVTAMLVISRENCKHPGSLHSILLEEYKGLSIYFSIGNSASRYIMIHRALLLLIGLLHWHPE
jgi:hypothetical protein